MEKSIRTLDSLGRIVIPRDFRRALEISESDDLYLSLSDNKIVIEKAKATCAFCDSTDKLTSFKDKYICSRCKSSLLK